jgi:multiple sugar transport system permease protein
MLRAVHSSDRVMTAPSVAQRPPAAGRRRRPSSLREKTRNRAAHVFLIPWFIGFFVIVAGPMLASLVMSFTDYRLTSTPQWNGIDNYVRMFTADPRFYDALTVTGVYVFVGVPLQLLVAFLLALALDTGMRGLTLYRAVFYLPSLLGGSVAIALLWRQLFGRDGLVNQMLALIGIEGVSWIGSPDTALGTLILLLMWQFGSPMIIFLAGLRQIPGELYEAASIDGANAFTRLIRITLPMLSPIIFFNLVLQIVNAFQAFTPAYVVSGGSGGPANSTLFYTLHLYDQGFRYLDMGYASALAWVLVAIIALFTAANFLAAKHWVFYGDD